MTLLGCLLAAVLSTFVSFVSVRTLRAPGVQATITGATPGRATAFKGASAARARNIGSTPWLFGLRTRASFGSSSFPILP